MENKIARTIRWAPIDGDTDERNNKTPKSNYYLVKITGRQWADKFLEGEMFLRNLAEFGIDHLIKDDSQFKNDFQGDVFEGLSALGTDPTSSFTASFREVLSQTETVSPEDIRYGNIDSRYLDENILSLYSLYFDETMSQFQYPDKRICEFGDTVVVIHDTFGFLRRLSNTLIESLQSPFWFDYEQVQYFDPNTRTEDRVVRDEFFKTIDYSWQNEFRIVVENLHEEVVISSNAVYNNEKGSLILSIGDISEFAFIMSVEEFLALGFTEEQRKVMKPPVPIFSLGLPRPERLSFLHPVIKVADKIFISKTAIHPVRVEKEDSIILFRQAMALGELRRAECDISGYLQIVDKYFRKHIAYGFSFDSSEFRATYNDLIEYIANIQVSKLGGVNIDEKGAANLEIDPSDIRYDGSITMTKYRRDYSISDAAFLMAHSDETEWPEYEYAGDKEGLNSGRYVRIVANTDCVLPSGTQVKKGEAVLFGVSKVEWLSHYRDELELSHTLKKISDLHQLSKETDEDTHDIDSLRSQNRMAEAVELMENEINNLTASLGGVASFEVAKAYGKLADMCQHIFSLSEVGFRSFSNALICWKELSSKPLIDSEIIELAALFDELAQFIAFSSARHREAESQKFTQLLENIYEVVRRVIISSGLSYARISNEFGFISEMFQLKVAGQFESLKNKDDDFERSLGSEDEIAEFCIAVTFALDAILENDTIGLSSKKRNSINTMAIIMEKQKRYSEQKDLLLEFVKRSEQSEEDDNSVHLMIAYHNLGNYYWGQRDYESAESYSIKSLEICKTKVLQNPLKYENLLAMGQLDLGSLYSSQKKNNKAILTYKQACESFEKIKASTADKDTFYDKYIDCLLALTREYKHKTISDARIEMVFDGSKQLSMSNIFAAAFDCVHKALDLCYEMKDSESPRYAQKCILVKIEQADLAFIMDTDLGKEYVYSPIESAISICKNILLEVPEAHYSSFQDVLEFIAYLYSRYQFCILEGYKMNLPSLNEYVLEYYHDILNFIFDKIESGELDVLLLYHPRIRNMTEESNSADCEFAENFQAVHLVCFESLCVIYAEASRKEEAYVLCRNFNEKLNGLKASLGELLYNVELEKVGRIEKLIADIKPILSVE